MFWYIVRLIAGFSLKQFAPGFAPPPKTIGFKTIESNRKISITKEICITIDPPKIPGRKPDSEAGCIFENFTLKQGNSLKPWRQVPVIMECHYPPPPGFSCDSSCSFVIGQFRWTSSHTHLLLGWSVWQKPKYKFCVIMLITHVSTLLRWDVKWFNFCQPTLLDQECLSIWPQPYTYSFAGVSLFKLDAMQSW